MYCRTSFVLLLVLSSHAIAAKPADPIPNATEHRNVRYLPGWRYAGDMAPHRDYQMVMDITVPKDGKDRHPVLFVVHGGGWSAGSKDQGIHRDIVRYFVKRGFVCVNLNYIMRPRGIFPQVFWDYADAARYLRRESTVYKVDPSRFGAIGLSAGGWLISSAGHASGDLLCLNHQQSIHIADLHKRGWSRAGRHYEEDFARPMSNPQPAYPGVYGRFQAISYDFSFRTKLGSGNSPACNQWVGEGYQLRDEDQAAVDAGRFEYSQTVLTHPSYKGRKVHVPPLFESLQKDGSNKAEAISRNGNSRVSAIERVYQFFQHQLVDDPRTPVPEIQPSTRIFDEEAEVRFLLPLSDAEVKYQIVRLNNSSEVGDWKKYSGAFKVKADCRVRAIATSPGRRPSTVAEAHYFKGAITAEVTGPDTKQLPPAVTGRPYSVRFTSDVERPHWFLAGDLVPYSSRNRSDYTYPNNMVMNYRTGEWSGIPVKPGRYWVQIWANARHGAIAGYRDYVWNVTGKDLSQDEKNLTQLNDPHVELVYLPGEKSYPASQIGTLLNQHGIRAIIEREKQGSLILVSKEETPKATRLIKEHLKSIKYKGEVQWQSAGQD